MQPFGSGLVLLFVIGENILSIVDVCLSQAFQKHAFFKTLILSDPRRQFFILQHFHLF